MPSTASLAHPRGGDYNYRVMDTINEKFPNPKEIEKELSEFLAKKFGGSVKLAAPVTMPLKEASDTVETVIQQNHSINFDLKPEALIAYLDQYLIKQDDAKAVLATKICTHFNRIKRQRQSFDEEIARHGGQHQEQRASAGTHRGGQNLHDPS
jgi:ATP-dependent Clp protease ATP-binding subunit ClpX